MGGGWVDGQTPCRREADGWRRADKAQTGRMSGGLGGRGVD